MLSFAPFLIVVNLKKQLQSFSLEKEEENGIQCKFRGVCKSRDGGDQSAFG